MIRVNLAGIPKKKAAKAAAKPAGPSPILPVIHLLIFAGAAAAGYYWYSGLTTEQARLMEEIRLKEEQQRQLQAIIKQDQVFEARKTALENRISVIEGLRRNQVNPVIAIDMIGNAVDRTQYVWLSSLSQNNTNFNMSGTGTSVDALTTLVRNLESTGYFRNINLQQFQDSRGNYTFSMSCEFAPPAPPEQAGERGAN